MHAIEQLGLEVYDDVPDLVGLGCLKQSRYRDLVDSNLVDQHLENVFIELLIVEVLNNRENKILIALKNLNCLLRALLGWWIRKRTKLTLV